jgi:hypothetical protein
MKRFALAASIVALTTFGLVGGLGSGAVASSPARLAPAASVELVAVATPPRPARSGPPDPALAEAVGAWVSNGGEADLRALGSDFKSLSTAANANDMGQMSASCARLQTDVEAAQQYDPIPDPRAQRDWTEALKQYARGATDCMAGADTVNPDLLTKASDEITAGSTSLNHVTTRLSQIAGH